MAIIKKLTAWALRFEDGTLREGPGAVSQGKYDFLPVAIYRTRREAKEDSLKGDVPVKVQMHIIVRELDP